MGCNCKKKPEPPAIIPPIESVHNMDNIDEFFVPETTNKELDKLIDEDEYPLIHD